jgi:hypothetical protein
MATDLLIVLHRQADYSFSQIMIGDESWFLYRYQSGHMFAVSRDEVIPREKATIKAQRVMLMIFFSGVSLITVNTLPSGERFTQECFINYIPPDIVEARRKLFGRVRSRDFLIQMDNSVCHNGPKVTDELANLKLDRFPDAPYSADLSLCDCWLFGMLKQKIKDRVFEIVHEMMMTFPSVREELILEDLQCLFFNWIEQVEYVSEHGGEYYTNSHQKII